MVWCWFSVRLFVICIVRYLRMSLCCLKFLIMDVISIIDFFEVGLGKN